MTIEDEYEEFCKELMDENRSLRKQLAAKCYKCKKYERQKTATEILQHLYEMGEFKVAKEKSTSPKLNGEKKKDDDLFD